MVYLPAAVIVSKVLRGCIDAYSSSPVLYLTEGGWVVDAEWGMSGPSKGSTVHRDIMSDYGILQDNSYLP
jgi:hypothetical protein